MSTELGKVTGTITIDFSKFKLPPLPEGVEFKQLSEETLQRFNSLMAIPFYSRSPKSISYRQHYLELERQVFEDNVIKDVIARVKHPSRRIRHNIARRVHRRLSKMKISREIMHVYYVYNPPMVG